MLSFLPSLLTLLLVEASGDRLDFSRGLSEGILSARLPRAGCLRQCRRFCVQVASLHFSAGRARAIVAEPGWTHSAEVNVDVWRLLQFSGPALLSISGCTLLSDGPCSNFWGGRKVLGLTILDAPLSYLERVICVEVRCVTR